MKRLHRIMLHKSPYLENVPLPEIMEDLCSAINGTKQFKPVIQASALTTLWNMKQYDGFRNRVQFLIRRKRGQWAALIKKEFIDLFLPSVEVKQRKRKRDDFIEIVDDEIFDCDSSALSREERFNIGVGFMIDRVRSVNGTVTLRVNNTPRFARPHVSHIRSSTHSVSQ